MTEEIKKKVFEAADKYESHTQHEGLGPGIFIEGATFGYGLSEKEISALSSHNRAIIKDLNDQREQIREQEKEIERLKGLVKKAFDKVQIWRIGSEYTKQAWQQFKASNNL